VACLNELRLVVKLYGVDEFKFHKFCCPWLRHSIVPAMHWLCFVLDGGQLPHAHMWCWALQAAVRVVSRSGAIHSILNWVNGWHSMHPPPRPWCVALPTTSPLPPMMWAKVAMAIVCHRFIAPA
jgi:hypothetical protein